MTIFTFTIVFLVMIYAEYLGLDTVITGIKHRDIAAVIFGCIYTFTISIFLVVYGMFFIHYIFT